jgi:hypothetical protein
VGVPIFPVGVPIFPGAPLHSKLTEAKARQATSKTQLRRFAAGFDPCNRGHSLFTGNALVATIAWIIVRLVQ